MLNLSWSVPEECDEKLLSEPSSNKAGGDEALTKLLKSMQKQLNSLPGQVKDMELDNKTSRQSFLNNGRRFRSNKFQDCLANNCACVHCFICGGEGHIARRCLQKGNGQGLRNWGLCQSAPKRRLIVHSVETKILNPFLSFVGSVRQ